VRVLGEIPAAGPTDLRAGTLRRCDQEAFGRLLEELEGARTVLITGDSRRKRTAAVGLAAAAAAAGTRTVLIECDLAQPSLAEALGLSTAPGLREHLRGEVDSSQILKPLALAGPGSAAAVEPLVCVVAGRPAVEGPALLRSEAFSKATVRLRTAYELVVVEGPPAPNGDGSMEALAAYADATLVCVGRSDRVPGLRVPVTGLVVED
jgi:polysaccharide biosynthesis transport protein